MNRLVLLYNRFTRKRNGGTSLRILKYISISLILLLLITMYPSTYSASAPNNNIDIFINGEKKDYKTITINGRTLVPLRGVFETLGAIVHWDPKTKVITAYNDVTKISLTASSKKVIVNDKVVQIDVPAFIKNGTTYVPLRFIGESFDATVNWDNSTRTIDIVHSQKNSLLGKWVVNFSNEDGTVSIITIKKVNGNYVEGTYGQFERILKGTINGNQINLKVYDSEASLRFWLESWDAPLYGKEVAVYDLLTKFKNETYSTFDIVMNRETNNYFGRWTGFNFNVDSNYNVTSIFLDSNAIKYGELTKVSSY